MKRTITLISILFATFANANAQNITLDELINLRKHNLAYVEEYLTNKGWSYIGTKGIYARFAYNKSDFYDKAESFIRYFGNEYIGSADEINIQIHDSKKYLSYINRIKSFGCKLIDNYTENSDIIKVYRGATTTFEVTVSTQKDDFYDDSTKTVYIISIMSNSFYDILVYHKKYNDKDIKPEADSVAY